MNDPTHLLSVAWLLLTPSVQPASEAQLRRAVSTAYYAVFHQVLRAEAARFMGPGMEQTSGYRLIYRGFNHGRVRTICRALNVAKLSPAIQKQLGRGTVSLDMRTFSEYFGGLQDVRELAAYDPIALFSPSDAFDTVLLAETALATFDRVADDERANVLALMLLNPRA